VTGPGCIARRGQVAMAALGALAPDEQAELEAHLATCAECRAVSTELRSTVGALDTRLDGGPPVPVAPLSAHLADAVLADLRAGDEFDRRRRTRRIGMVVGGTAAAAVLVVLLVLVGTSRPTWPTRTVALTGTPGVTASAVLEERSWGTALTVHEQGLASGRTYTVSMSNPQGRWWTAGSYRASGTAPVEVTMGCAAPFATIDEIRVTGPDGRTVLVDRPGGAY
jgi:hypothetical protein